MAKMQAEFKRGIVLMATFVAGEKIEAGDLLGAPTGPGAGAGTVRRLTKAGYLLGIAHNDAEAGEKVQVEVPLGAVYRVTAAPNARVPLTPGLPIVAWDGGTFVGEPDGQAGSPICGYVVDAAASGGQDFRASLISFIIAALNPYAA
jgi:hypothetical protein